MAGKHEPPSTGSFYLSVATSTLRAAIIVAAIVLGGVVLANAFPGTVAETPRTGVTTTPGPSPTPTGTRPASPAPAVEGAILQVLNGTSIDGLATETAGCLRDAGAVIPDENLGEPPEDYAITTLLFVPGQRPLAEVLEGRFFPEARVVGRQVDPDFPDVQVTVILGDDYEAVAECA